MNCTGTPILKTRDAQVFTRRGTEDPPEDEDAVLSSPRRVVVALFDVVLAVVVVVGGLHDTLVARGKRIHTQCDSRDTTQLEKVAHRGDQ